ncbi:MAG TPA: VWA domain-containing protein [Terriglobia bacterium]|nr:VWA domain-containing protein [Terriglobia bacterium]
MKRRHHTGNRFAVASFTTVSPLLLLGGALLNAPPIQAQDTSPEITTQNSQPGFALRVQRNEVLVRVVVRDAKDQAVTQLQKDDFQIFDNGKLQAITHFSLDISGAAGSLTAPSISNGTPPEPGVESTPAIRLAHRFMALFFDDVHIEFADLVRTRDAADHYLATQMKPGDRVAIFTSSGQNQVDFTDDRAKLHDALLTLQPRPMSTGVSECPEILPNQAFKIAEQRDDIAIQVATQDAIYTCCGGPGNPCPQADPNYIDMQARHLVDEVESETRHALQGLERLCRRMAVLPGQRSIVVVSPGFLLLTQNYGLAQIVDQALRLNVVISTLDARGLYTDILGGDASERGAASNSAPSTAIYKSQYKSENKSMNGDVLTALASDTGGVAFRNSNDYAGGFERVGGFADASYLLAFAPQDLKPDGRMHTLKVTLVSNPGRYTLQARKSYFAPKKNEDPATLAADRLEQLVFSEDESQAIPLNVHTQFFKTGVVANLSIMARMDISHVQFRKAESRELNKLTLVTVLFDSAGNYVDGKRTVLDLKLKDATLAKLRETGINMKTTFSVKPGSYLVREVVQDSEGDQLSASSSQVEIP